MSKRYFVETTEGGRKQFVSVKRSRSYSGHHNRVREIDYVKVSLDEWNGLVEKEKKLVDINKKVVDEVNVLKGTLNASENETRRLANGVVPTLEKRIAVLAADNELLHRTIEKDGNNSSKHHREEDKLRHKVMKLEKDNIDLRQDKAVLAEKNKDLQRQADQGFGRRVSELIADVDYWKSLARSWKSRYEGLLKRYDEIFDLLQARTKKLRAYEDILQRNGML